MLRPCRSFFTSTCSVAARFAAVALFACFLCCVLPGNALCKDFIVTNNWPPFINQETGGGLQLNKVMAVLQESGWADRVEIHFMPWSRCEKMVQQGAALGSFPYVQTEERSAFSMFSDPLYQAHTRFFYRNDRLPGFVYESLESLKPFTVGGVRGYYYEHIFKDENLNYIPSYTEKESFKRLYVGITDVTPMDVDVGWNIISTMYPEEQHLFSSTKNDFSKEIHRMMVSRRHVKGERFLEDFNNALKRINTKSQTARH